MTKKSKKWLERYKQSDYKKNRTLTIRKKFISSEKDNLLKSFQQWLGTRNGKIFRIVIIFWILQIIYVRYIL
jgi:hypothetical protein